jgi:polyhydroxyalkanoate synthesis regulator phasin
MYFEEQAEVKREIREMDEEIDDLRNQVLDLSSRVNLLFKV